jgi:hypothetical protein
MKRSLLRYPTTLIDKPMWSMLLTAFGITATFTISILWAVGLELLFLVDQARLLVGVVAYAAAIAVGGRVVFMVYKALHLVLIDLVSVFIRHISKEKARNRPNYRQSDTGNVAEVMLRRRWRVFALILQILIPTVLVTGFFLNESSRFHLNWTVVQDRLVWNFIAAIVGALISGIVAFRIRGDATAVRSFRFLLVMAQFSIIITAWVGGALWVKYLRDVSPQVALTTRTAETPQAASIVLPAHDGFLAFVGGSQLVSFVPLSEVVQIVGRTSVY